MQQQVLRSILPEVDCRVIGLVGIENGVDLASEAGHELMVHKIHHRVKIDLPKRTNT